MDLEKVEKLRGKAKVSYEEAKAALDAANGDVLDALIELERQGKVDPPENAGFYSSRDENGSGYERAAQEQAPSGSDASDPKQSAETGSASGKAGDAETGTRWGWCGPGHPGREFGRRWRQEWKKEDYEQCSQRHAKQKAHVKGIFREFLHWLGRVIHKGNTNYLDITKRVYTRENGVDSSFDRVVATVPLTVLAVLLIFAFWITLPVMVVCMFFGYRYSIRGPEMTMNGINRAMDKVADAATDIKTEIKHGME